MNDLRQQIRDLLDRQNLGVLATSAKGHPYTSLVGFAVTEQFDELLFATHRATRKYSYVQEDSRVSLLIDSRTNQVDDFRDAVALSAVGTAREVPPEQRQRLLDIFVARHPYLGEFVRSPGCALCVIKVQRYSLVQRFQDVQELDFDEPHPAP